jgi:hypothetical protein
MGAVVTLLAVVCALLVVLVAGLLRSHALILRRLEELGAGIGDPADRAAASSTAGADGFEPPPGSGVPIGRAAVDVVGVDPTGDALALRIVGAKHDTVLAFLSSTCLTCAGFWEELRTPGRVPLPEGTRLVVVAKGAGEESPSAIAELAPRGVTTVLSSEAWEAYDVPGSPYVVCVDGPTGTVKGEGTGGSWAQVARLLAQATGDLAFVEEGAQRRRKARRDAERESDIDAALLQAGVLPGDERLYTPLDHER